MTRPAKLAIVIPCLNEAEGLAATCRSLGFGGGAEAQAHGVHLVLVDNGSTDSTSTVMARVVDSSVPGEVSVVQELTRGYVPARHRGALRVREYAAENRVDERDMLVLQADADTIYCHGYVDAIRAAASRVGPS